MTAMPKIYQRKYETPISALKRILSDIKSSVSIVIPHWNNVDVLSECLESISATDLNGGSTGADLWLTMSYAGSPQNMSVVAYRIGGVGMVSKALSVSGDTITAYTRQTVHASGNWLWGNVKYDNGIGRICYFYVRDGNSEASAIIMADLATNGTISNFSNFHEFDTSNTAVIWGDTNEVGRGVCGYKDDNGSHTEAATPIVGAEGGNISDPGQYLGFADQAYTDGQTATIKTYGNNVSTLSGLSPATMYYVQANGDLATTADGGLTGYFVTGTPVAGTALIGNSIGQKDKNKVLNYFTHIIFYGILVSIIITYLGLSYAEKVFYLMGSTDEVISLGLSLIHI